MAYTPGSIAIFVMFISLLVCAVFIMKSYQELWEPDIYWRISSAVIVVMLGSFLVLADFAIFSFLFVF